MALLKIVNNPTDVGDADHVGGPDWDASAAWINAIKGVASGQILVSQGDNPPIAGGALTNVAFINTGQTYSATNTFSVAQLFNNAVQLQWKDFGGTARGVLTIDSSDRINLGNSAGNILRLFSGNASTPAMAFDATNQVTTSPTWGVALTLNNGIALMGKDSGGTARNMLRYVNDDVYLTNYHATGDMFIFTGGTTSISINEVGTITTFRAGSAGAAETLMQWQVTDSANTSYIRFANFATQDAVFAPRAILTNMDSADQIEFLCQCGPTFDTGGQAMISLYARKTDNTAITVRPLFELKARNFVPISVSANGLVSQNISAQAGVAEVLHTWWGPNDTDANSFFQLVNSSATDAQFASRLVASTSVAATNALQIYGMILPANDSGTSGIINIDARRNDGAAVTTRPLFQVRNANTVLAEVSPAGRFTLTHTDEGLIEQLINITLSDASGSYFRVSNNLGGVAGHFSPIILGHNAVANATYSGLYLQGSVDPAQDTGTVPVITIDSRHGTGGTLATRPLITFRNAADNLFTIKANGDLSAEHKAQAGVGEILSVWTVQDDVGSTFTLQNASAVDAIFAPRFTSTVSLGAGTTSSAHYWQNVINATNDTGTTPIWVIDCRLSTAVDVAVRPLFDFRNRLTSIFKITAKGEMNWVAIAQTGAAEMLADYKISDNSTAYFRIENGSSTDAAFIPQLKSYNFNAGPTSAGFSMRHYIRDTEDTGAVTICMYDVRRSTEAAITSRCLYEWRNFGVRTFALLANGDTDNANGRIINVSNLLYKPSYKKAGSWIPTAVGNVGYGTLSTLTFAGTQTFGNDTAIGTKMLFDTTTTINSIAGIRSNSSLSIRSFNPRVKIGFRLNQLTDVKMYLGFKNTTTMPTTDDPANAIICFMFGFSSTVNATNWIIWQNDATGATVTTDTGIPADTAVHSIEIMAVNSPNKCTYSLDGATPVDVTTEIPNPTGFLAFVFSITNSIAASKTFDLLYIEAEQDK